MTVTVQFSPLAEHLASEKIIDREILLQAAEEAAQKQISVIYYLIELGHLSSDPLAKIAASFFNLPILELPDTPVSSWPIERVPWSVLVKTQAIPLQEYRSCLHVAMIDPGDPYALDLLPFYFGKSVHPKLVRSTALKKLFDQLHTQHHTKILSRLNTASSSSALSAIKPLTPSNDSEEPVIQWINTLLEDAFRKKASDIHLESFEHHSKIRFRIDGLLYDIAEIPATITPRIIARLKIMAKLDIAERRLPQDGHYKISLAAHQTVDVRVSTCPTLHGEKVVLRLLHQQQTLRPLSQLGFTAEQLQQFQSALSKPQGLILVTGPTGSGKTVTLYAALQYIDSATKNILTVEDPVEINLPTINQVQINPKTGLDFACALRAFLRQDPDVIMIGEIRDLETAEIAIKASQTGHLVLATLHTNSAKQALSRLQNMGIAPYLLAAALSLITAQRLIRQLCNHCKKAYTPSKELQKIWLVPDATLYRAHGCSHCQGGYHDRFAIHELLPIQEDFFNPNEIIPTHYPSLLEHGIHAAVNGLTSLEELERALVIPEHSYVNPSIQKTKK